MDLVFQVLVFIVLLTVGDGQIYIKTNASLSAGTEYVGKSSTQQFNGTSYDVAQFLGIPYAMAPTGNRRFAKPERYLTNATSYNATNMKNRCHGSIFPSDSCTKFPMDEDCLYLNIYVPIPTLSMFNLVTNDTSTIDLPVSSGSLRSVFVFIHGGGFFAGSSNCIDASILSAYGDIIVVTFNYRLGPLGFLSTDDGVIPANLGLWDQREAIKWVSQNIAAFGGDPTKITVGGQSAGGISAVFQGLYPGNDQLFKRIISQSGNPAANKSMALSGYSVALQQANLMNCNIMGNGKSKEIKECLTTKDARSFFSAIVPLQVPLSLAYGPILDKDFISNDTGDMFRLAINKSTGVSLPSPFLNKDLLVGFTMDDGEVIYRLRAREIAAEAKFNSTILFQNIKNPSMTTFEQIVTEFLAPNFTEKLDEIVLHSIVDRYIDWDKLDDPYSVGKQTIYMLTDVGFAIPTAIAAQGRSMARDSNSSYSVATYVYRLNLPSDNYYYKDSALSWFQGTSHSDDMPFVFGIANSSAQSYDITKSVMTYWSNFVKTGNPNMPGNNMTSNVTVLWPAFTTSNSEYLDISSPSISKSQLALESRNFWYEYLPKLYARLNTAVPCPTVKLNNSGPQHHYSLCLTVIFILSLGLFVT